MKHIFRLINGIIFFAIIFIIGILIKILGVKDFFIYTFLVLLSIGGVYAVGGLIELILEKEKKVEEL